MYKLKEFIKFIEKDLPCIKHYLNVKFVIFLIADARLYAGYIITSMVLHLPPLVCFLFSPGIVGEYWSFHFFLPPPISSFSVLDVERTCYLVFPESRLSLSGACTSLQPWGLALDFCAIPACHCAPGVSTQLLLLGMLGQRCAQLLCLLVAMLGIDIALGVLSCPSAPPCHTPPLLAILFRDNGICSNFSVSW